MLAAVHREAPAVAIAALVKSESAVALLDPVSPGLLILAGDVHPDCHSLMEENSLENLADEHRGYSGDD